MSKRKMMATKTKPMTDHELYRQTNDAIIWMCTRLSESCQTCNLIGPHIPEDQLLPQLEGANRTLENLGDVMNAIDIQDESDRRTDSVFDALHKRFPRIQP